MGLFSGKSSSEKKKDKQREAALASLKGAVAAGNEQYIFAGFFHLGQEKLLDAPEVPFVLSGAVEQLSRRDLNSGLGLALYGLQSLHNDAVQSALGEKALTLAARANRDDMDQMARVAALTGVLTAYADKGSDMEKRGRAAWKSATEALFANEKGLQFAFAAASNAALGYGRDQKLAAEGMDLWERAVVQMAKTDLNAATTEIRRVALGYEDMGAQSLPFRLRAVDAIRKIDVRLGK